MKISASLLALVGAIAPPRISLNLEGMTSSYKLASPIVRSHDLTYQQNDNAAVLSRQDWTEKCPAKRVCPTESCESAGDWTLTTHDNCPFPKAQGYDHQDKEVCVTTRIFLMDEDGVATASASQQVHGTKSFSSSDGLSCQHAQGEQAAAYATFDFTKRSTYLFKYDASDAAGNRAEQVVFALILDDTQAPLFNTACTNTNADLSVKTFEAAITVEAVSDWQLCNLGAYDNVDTSAGVHATKYTVTWLQRDHSEFTSIQAHDGNQACFRATNTFLAHADVTDLSDARTNTASVEAGVQGVDYATAKAYFGGVSGPDHVGKFLVEFQTEDEAQIYGHNAANNVRKIQQAILVRDTVNPTIYLEGSDPDYTECIAVKNDPPTYWEKYDFEESDCQDKLDTEALDRYLPVTTTIANLPVHVVGTCATAKYPTTPRKAQMQSLLDWTAGFNELAAMTPTQMSAGKSTTLTYSCADYSGNTADEVTRTVHTVDTHAPTLELTSRSATGDHTLADRDDNTRVVQYIVDYNDATHSTATHQSGANQEALDSKYGAFAEDSCDTSVSAVTDGSNGFSMSWGPRAFNTKQLGDYVRTYTASDQAGNIATKTRTYTVIDQDDPVITAMNCAGMSVTDCTLEATRESEYTDTGATCHDFIDGELSHAVEVSGEVVNMRIPGTYTINYNCQDLSGNPAPQVVRQVTIQDLTAPYLTLQGASVNYVEAGFPYVDGGATATDTLDGDITQYIWTEGNTVDTIYGASSCEEIKTKMEAAGNTFQNGEYMVLTKASNGGINSEITEKVHCFKEASGDVISFKYTSAGPKTCADLGMVNFGTVSNDALAAINAAYGQTYTKAELASNLCKLAVYGGVATASAAPQQVTGKYIIIYNVEDKKGNSAVTVQRTVVVKDTLPPVITLTLKDKLVHQSDGSQVGIGHQMRSGVFNAANPTQFNPAGFSKAVYENKVGVPASYVKFGNPYLMAESSNVNGWVIGAVASAVAGVALLGFSAKKSATTVPV